jgi:hypothetical protein
MSGKSNPEFERFDKTMDTLLKVSHDDLKAALDAEKAAKAEKRRAKKPSASGRASRDKD